MYVVSHKVYSGCCHAARCNWCWTFSEAASLFSLPYLFALLLCRAGGPCWKWGCSLTIPSIHLDDFIAIIPSCATPSLCNTGPLQHQLTRAIPDPKPARALLNSLVVPHCCASPSIYFWCHDGLFHSFCTSLHSPSSLLVSVDCFVHPFY